MLTEKEIKQYWDIKAYEGGDFVTIKDYWFRELETEYIAGLLKNSSSAIDIGAGDGYATAEYSEILNGNIIGIDFSEPMVELANIRYGKMCTFVHGTAVELPFADGDFDAAVMTRCLINIPSRESQYLALREAHRVLKSGGIFLLSEVTIEGHERINKVRELFGLCPLKKHWHNTYVEEEELLRELDIIGFDLCEIKHFGIYMLISKVVHPLAVYPEEPKFMSKWNEVAYQSAKNANRDLDCSHQNLFVLIKR